MNLVFIGAGSIATSLGNSMARIENNKVLMITIEKEVEISVRQDHINTKYFPGIVLDERLKATLDIARLRESDMIFLAIPSVETVKYLTKHKDLIPAEATIVNLAKGFGEKNCTITTCLKELLPNPICTMKGPTFARDIINNQPTAFTVGADDPVLFKSFREVFQGTNIFLDFSTDVEGVEILSILKNIYAIVAGVTDASFDAPNLRSLLLTKAFKEMRRLLGEFGGREDTMFHYCGFGDFTLTALNDLSRNRTLGLLIGKGFFTKEMSDQVVLEGKIAVNVITERLAEKNKAQDFPILAELHKVFNDHYDLSSFVRNILYLSEKTDY
jgi:glycerol-3-phosphate dehydrogenase (NAD(P)+)